MRVRSFMLRGWGGLVCAGAALSISHRAPAGPDITQQELQDTANYGQGTVAGTYGYAWGSYACNMGNASLSWIFAGTPALAMNAYRLHDGRLVQIGLGYAKHACCVSSGSGCGTCSAAGFGLRPGCRDVYGAATNGGQSRLGPRSGINPYDGTFATIPEGSGDAVWRRVQIRREQMSAATYPGALYFAEGEYVCMEEAPAEELNNVTYRRMSVANTAASPTYSWTVAAGSATVSGQPAIYAWRDHGNGVNTPDNSVVVVNVDVPGEGRFVAAGKARDLGDGTWRYDYAVFNLNSHRSGAGLSVMVPAAAAVTGIGFSSPSYHSGEIYDNAPWTFGNAGGAVSWNSPAAFAANPNTNALRWGTMYNFWFTADVPPAAALGELTLRLFRPGTPDTIQISGLPVPSVCRPDFNNDGGVSVEDIFQFLAAYFSGGSGADFNGVGGVTVQDIFDFLDAYFVGCV